MSYIVDGAAGSFLQRASHPTVPDWKVQQIPMKSQIPPNPFSTSSAAACRTKKYGDAGSRWVEFNQCHICQPLPPMSKKSRKGTLFIWSQVFSTRRLINSGVVIHWWFKHLMSCGTSARSGSTRVTCSKPWSSTSCKDWSRSTNNQPCCSRHGPKKSTGINWTRGSFRWTMEATGR